MNIPKPEEKRRIRIGGGGPYVDRATEKEIRHRSKDLQVSLGVVIDIAMKDSRATHKRRLKASA